MSSSEDLIKYESYFRPEHSLMEKKLIAAAVRNDTEELKLLLHCDDSGMLLHRAAMMSYVEIARLLIENGADINAQDENGCTPLHMFLQTNDSVSINEGVAMLLFYGADVSVCRALGKNALEDALDLYHVENILPAQEHLFYHAVDECYELSIDVLCDLIENKSPFFHKMVESVSRIVLDEDIIHLNVDYYMDTIFCMDLEYLQTILQKFDYVISEILGSSPRILTNYHFKPSSIENFKLLLESHLAFDTIEFIGNCVSIHHLIRQLHQHKICPEATTDLIHYLLTYGVNVYDEDLETVYEVFGYCELFKVLLHQDIKKLTRFRNIIPTIIYDVTVDIKDYLKNPLMYGWHESILDYFADLQLQYLCFILTGDKFAVKVRTLPQIPLLLELARNATRQFLIEKFHITSSKQFYSLLHWLPISKAHKKIISFETTLY